MLWTAVLPFQITCVLIVAGYTAFVIAAPKWKMERGHAAALGVGLATLGFIPLCMGVDALLYPFRFGEFHYKTAAEANDYHVRRSIPEAAQDLTVHQYNTGFCARYAITREELDAWLDAEWERMGERAVGEREEPDEPPEKRTAEELDSPGGRLWLESKAKLRTLTWSRFSDLGWPMPEDVIFLEGPHAQNGAGSSYYYSEAEGRAYQDAGYW